MRICIIGGIFDKPDDYRARHSISPETVLADGLRQHGWDVTLSGHSAPPPPGPFDLIHVHHFGRAALRLAAATSRPPFVITTHDPFAMNGLPVGWKRRLTDGFVLRKADAVIALSDAEHDFLTRRRRLPPHRIAVIPNGVNTTVFDRVTPAHPSKEYGEHALSLLFVGQLQEFKGLDYLLAALPAVRAAFPASNCESFTRPAPCWIATRHRRRGSDWATVWSSPAHRQPPVLPAFIPPPRSSYLPAWVSVYRPWYWRPCVAARP